jgi:ferredoxin
VKEVTRRALLKGIVQASGAAVGIGAATAAGHVLLRPVPRRLTATPASRTRASRRLVRPPGAVEEDAFLAGCIRCYRCQDACDIGAVRFFTETDGELYHTPYVDPEIKACNLCMRCTHVCPTHVLRPLEREERAKVDMASVELRQDLCLSYKAQRIRDEQAMLMELGRSATESEAVVERRGPCGECYMFCPLREKAIKLEPGAFLAPLVFEKECVGCGMCEEICRAMVRGDPAIRVVATRQRA